MKGGKSGWLWLRLWRWSNKVPYRNLSVTSLKFKIWEDRGMIRLVPKSSRNNPEIIPKSPKTKQIIFNQIFAVASSRNHPLKIVPFSSQLASRQKNIRRKKHPNFLPRHHHSQKWQTTMAAPPLLRTTTRHSTKLADSNAKLKTIKN